MLGRRTATVVLIFVLAACSTTAAPTATPAPPASPAIGGAPSPSTPARTITIVGSGDVLLHPGLWAQARADGHGTYDFRPLLAAVKPLVETADVAICHLETPVAPPTGPFRGYPSFSVPPQVVPALRDLGYDTCSTASNHSLDQGQAGIERTLAALDQSGIRHTGTARSESEQRSLNLLDVGGVRVAQLSYTFGFNGLRRPAGREWSANLTDADAILAEARRAKAAGAAIVVVSLHWGTEYEHKPTRAQTDLARRLLTSPDVDLILGCHAHVVQPMAKINGKWVVYGMGNQVAHHADPITDNREGIMPRFTFAETSPGHWTATAAEAIPVWMELGPDRLVLPAKGTPIYERIAALAQP